MASGWNWRATWDTPILRQKQAEGWGNRDEFILSERAGQPPQKAWRDVGWDINGTVDDAASEVHEGIHVARNKRGLRGSGEEEAYEATSYVGEAGHSPLSSGVWNESWANGPDKEILRSNAIKEGIKRSEDASKNYEEKKKK